MSSTNINPHNRASLLAGLRTGGVRSASLPHTATPAGSFNVSTFPHTLPTIAFPDEDEVDQVSEMPQRHVYTNRNMPMTAAVDGPNNRFSSQQAAPRGMNPLCMPFNPPQTMSNPQVQLQMMQLEMMRLQVSTISYLATRRSLLIYIFRRPCKPNSFKMRCWLSRFSNSSKLPFRLVRGVPASVSIPPLQLVP